MTAFDRQEALRYLGYRNTEPDAAVADSLARCAAELQAAVQPKSVFAAFPAFPSAENTLEIAGVTIRSETSRATQGLRAGVPDGGDPRRRCPTADRRASAVRMSDAVLYQAAAAAMIETCCDEVNDAIPAGGGEGRLVLPPAVQPGLRGF